MERFLTKETLERSKKKAQNSRRILFACAGGGLALYTLLCRLTRTENAGAMLIAAMAVLALTGWAVILLWMFFAEPTRAEANHLESLSSREETVLEGRAVMNPEGFRIPKSVRVRKVALETAEGTVSLNLNEKLADRMPPDGSEIRAAVRGKTITGLEVVRREKGGRTERQRSKARHFLKGLGRFLLPGTAWGVLAVIFTGFVFSGLTDAEPEQKITVYADCAVRNETELAVRLERALGGAVRMVKVHPFTYALFGTKDLKTADLYILPDGHLADYGEWVTGEGVILYGPETEAAAAEYFEYLPGETYRLYTGAASAHLADGLAKRAAELVAGLIKENPETEGEKQP